MATATVEDVRALDLANDFENVTDGFIQCMLDDFAVPKIGPVWDDAGLRKQGEAAVAAHFVSIALDGKDGRSGAISSESIAGGPSVSYVSSGKLTAWDRTLFGQMYLSLRRTLPSTPLALNSE